MASGNMSVRDIIREIREGNPRPVYILMGEEAYFIDLIVENMEKYIIPEEDKDFNFNIFFGNDADIDYVVGVAQQFPVMAPRKLVILKEAQSMYQAKTQLEKFSSYVSHPNPNAVFVITFKGGILNATSKLIKAAKATDAIVFNSEVPRSYHLTNHIRDYCRDRKVSIDQKAMELLAENIGAPLSKLFGEINKLISIVGGKTPRITCDDIERHIGISKEFNNLELVNALSVKDYPRCIKIIKYFAANPKTNPTVLTTGTILNFFSNLVIAHYLPDKSDQALSQALGFKAAIQLTNMKTAMRNYSPMQAVNAIHYLREFDTKSKGVGSMLDEYDLLAEMVFKIFT